MATTPQCVTDPTGSWPASAAWRERLHRVVPGGAHTYAKGDDQYPLLCPPVLVRGEGCRVWDADGHEYLEYGMGLRAVTLGHGFPPVVEAAHRQMLIGCNFTRPSPIEAVAAERLLAHLPAADMVKFAKNGSDATTAAVRLARAVTGRDRVAVCRDQPFFSTDDWFIGVREMPAGIPEVVRDLTLTFPWNDLPALEALLQAHDGQVACVMLEPDGATPPAPGWLAGVRALCDRTGTLLVFDEMITGFRWAIGGGQAVHHVAPDLSTWGKALGNGFAVSALAGRREYMERGGLRTDAERVFLLSTTHGAEGPALAAAIAVIHAYEREPVVEILHRQGARLREGVTQAARAAGVADHFVLRGRDCNLVWAALDPERQPSQGWRTLFLQEMVRGGVLCPSFVTSYAHTDEAIDRTVDAAAKAFRTYALALTDGLGAHLVGPPVRPVFRPRVG